MKTQGTSEAGSEFQGNQQVFGIDAAKRNKVNKSDDPVACPQWCVCYSTIFYNQVPKVSFLQRKEVNELCPTVLEDHSSNQVAPLAQHPVVAFLLAESQSGTNYHTTGDKSICSILYKAIVIQSQVPRKSLSNLITSQRVPSLNWTMCSSLWYH